MGSLQKFQPFGQLCRASICERNDYIEISISFKLFFKSDIFLGFCPPSPPQPVREVYYLRLSLLRLILQYDGRRIRLRHHLPSLQGGGREEEVRVDVV